MDNLTKEANKLIPKLRDENNDSERIQTIREADPFTSLRNTLFSFFSNVLARVQQEDDLKMRVKKAIEDRLEQDNAVTFPQLLNLLDALNSDNQRLMDSILAIFKPTPGTGEISPFVNPAVKGDDTTTAFSHLKSGQRDTIDRLTRVLEKAEQLQHEEELQKKEESSE